MFEVKRRIVTLNQLRSQPSGEPDTSKGNPKQLKSDSRIQPEPRQNSKYKTTTPTTTRREGGAVAVTRKHNKAREAMRTAFSPGDRKIPLTDNHDRENAASTRTAIA